MGFLDELKRLARPYEDEEEEEEFDLSAMDYMDSVALELAI